MVAEIMPEQESEWAAMGRVAEFLVVGTAETVRKWVRQAEVDAGARQGCRRWNRWRSRRLRREVAELKRANAILNVALVSSRLNSTGHSGDRPFHQPQIRRVYEQSFAVHGARKV